jgi:hypothetical protein
MSLMRLHMFLQLITAVEVLPTIRVFTSVFAHLTMSSAVLGKIGGFRESLAADVTLQGLVFCVGSFVDS